MSTQKLPKLVRQYLTQGFPLKVEFDINRFSTTDIICAGPGRQDFKIDYIDNKTIVYMTPIIIGSTYDSSDLFPGTEFIRHFSAIGEYEEEFKVDQVNDIPINLVEQNVVEEIKQGNKTILRIKGTARNERKPSTVLGIVYGKSNYKNLLK